MKALQASPLLSRVGIGLLLASGVTAGLMLLDSRSFNGVSTWLKPWKFQFSLALQLLTLALFMQALAPDARRLWTTRLWSWVSVITALFEAGYITVMGALNQASHFNLGTPFTALMYSLMGALMLGWLLGSATGGYMSAQPGHWVGGTASDAGGLWLFGWSRDGGDLRVAHFVGLHAMQGIALVAWWLVRKAGSAAAHSRALVTTGAVAALWTVLTGFTFWQAVNRLPLLPR